MPSSQTGAVLSPRRARLLSFDRAYAVAVQLRRSSGTDAFVVRTGNPLQPFRVTSAPTRADEQVLAWVA